MDWVHCNNCFIVPGAGKRFFLTSCGHIYCADCKISCTSESCKLCGNQCSTIPLSSQMKPDVEIYFTDPFELLKKYLKQVQQVADFQSNHRARLMMYQADQVNRSRKMEDDYKRIREDAKMAKKILKTLNEENHKLKIEIENVKSSRSGYCNHPSMNSNAVNMMCATPSYPETSRGLVSHGNSSAGSHKSIENIREFLSPCDSVSSFTSAPSRISVRTPPMNGRMGVVAGVTSNSGGSNLRSQGSTPSASPLYSTPTLPQLSELLKKCTTESRGRKVQLPSELQNTHTKKVSVLPYHSGE